MAHATAPDPQAIAAETSVFGTWTSWRLPHHNANWFLLRGLVALAFGAFALILPTGAFFTLALVFAAFTFADGLFSMVSGLRGARHHTERWGALLFNGAVGLLVGVLFVIWPIMSTITYAFMLTVIMAVFYLATGIGQIAAAVRLRREIEGEWILGLLGITSLLVGGALTWLVWTRPEVTLFAVAWMIGIYALMAGGFLIALSLRLRRQ